MRSTLRLSFLPPAFCRAADGSVRGTCAAPGSADPGCAAAGGVRCADARGPNGIACDADDDTPWTLFPLHAALTTATATARVADWMMSEGVCTAEGGLNCIEDGNCVPPATCAGVLFGCGSGANVNDCEVTAGPGSSIGCASLRAGSLTGWRLVGAVPYLDRPAGLRDGVIEVALECE